MPNFLFFLTTNAHELMMTWHHVFEDHVATYMYNHYHMCNTTCVNINQYLWPKKLSFH